jgi:hypothetical protein
MKVEIPGKNPRHQGVSRMSPGRQLVSEQYQGTAAYIVQHSVLPTNPFFRIISFTNFPSLPLADPSISSVNRQNV